MYERQDEMTTPDEWREAMLISWADDLWDADDQESRQGRRPDNPGASGPSHENPEWSTR